VMTRPGPGQKIVEKLHFYLQDNVTGQSYD
jgi:hypothetical protein